MENDNRVLLVGGQASISLDEFSLAPISKIDFFDDFLGAYLQKYTTLENTTSLWKTVETALNAAIGVVAGGTNGIVQITLDSDDNAEVGVLHWGDNESLLIGQGLIFEARVSWPVLPLTGTETVQSVVGLAGAHNADLDTVDVNAWFRIESGANTTLLWETDDDITNDDDNSTGITLVAGTYYTLKIDASDKNNVMFYVDGVLVGTGSMAGITGTTGKVQPYFNVSKAVSANNTGTGTMYIDYVRILQDRS